MKERTAWRIMVGEVGSRRGDFKTISCREPASRRRSRVAGELAAATSSVAEEIAPGRGDSEWDFSGVTR